MRIDILPRSYFEERRGSFEIGELLRRHKVISIQSSNGWDSEPQFAKEHCASKNLLCLVFGDYFGIPDDPVARSRVALFTPEHADRIMRFVDDGSMCTQGVSHSGAVGYVLDRYCNRIGPGVSRLDGTVYLKAYARVKRGDLVVYAGWGDSLKSVVWVILLPVGFFMHVSAINDHSAWSKCMAVASVLLGVSSVLWLIVGAFWYNRTVGDGFTALGAWLLTALLALFVVAKVQEKLEKFGKGELNVVRGALIPLAVLGLTNW